MYARVLKIYEQDRDVNISPLLESYKRERESKGRLI